MPGHVRAECDHPVDHMDVLSPTKCVCVLRVTKATRRYREEQISNKMVCLRVSEVAVCLLGVISAEFEYRSHDSLMRVVPRFNEVEPFRIEVGLYTLLLS